MRYKHISNNPFDRHRINYPFCTWDGAFSEDELNDIENYCDNFDSASSKVSGNELLSNHRKSKIAWFQKNQHSKLHLLFDKLNLVIEKINDEYYNYDLNGYPVIQYTTYNGNELDHYEYHVDMHIGNNIESHGDIWLKYGDTRKLSLSLILSDSQSYEGGNFTMRVGESEFEIEQKRGRIIFFPSFILHKVHPVTKGIRKSVVAWVEGPKFR
jgi:PKHD-type hydroxylase